MNRRTMFKQLAAGVAALAFPIGIVKVAEAAPTVNTVPLIEDLPPVPISSVADPYAAYGFVSVKYTHTGTGKQYGDWYKFTRDDLMADAVRALDTYTKEKIRKISSTHPGVATHVKWYFQPIEHGRQMPAVPVASYLS